MPQCHVWVPIAILLAVPWSAPAQTATFEVASIKEAAPWTPAEMASGRSHLGLKITPGSVEIRFQSLRNLVALAYQVEEDQLSGPRWLLQPMPFEVPLVDIQAKLPPGASRAQVPEMLRALLAERFHLSVHREMAERPIYALVVGDKGLQLKAAAAGGSAFGPPPGSNVSYDYGIADDVRRQIVNHGNDRISYEFGPDLKVAITGQNVPGAIDHIEASKATLSWLAKRLSDVSDHRVVDRTGLTGIYRMTLDLPRIGSARSNVAPFVARLGLKLVKQTAPVEILVVDHMEKTPTAN
jgi:uncharacterized protein (TIGR03435 family)